MNMPITKIPPQNIEAEQTVLGTMLLSPSSVAEVVSILSSGDFYKTSHGLIFDCFCRSFKASGRVDVVTIMDELRRAGELEKCGGSAYLAELTEVIASPKNIRAHCSIIKGHAKSREIITIGSAAIEQCYDGAPAGEVLGEISGLLAGVSAGESINAKNTADIVTEVMADIDGRHNGTVELYGIKTGFPDFDNMTSGLQKSDFIILAGRPSMGKTTLAMNICTAAARGGKKGLIFSLEMEKSKLIKKQISSLSGVDIKAMDRALLNDQTWPAVRNAAKFVASLPIIVDDSSGLPIGQIQARAKMEAMKGGLDWIMVDYLQLATSTGKDGRTNEIREISAGLKAIAKDLNIPVLALSQLNRSLESRENKKPMMSDLRESGALEQDADVISFIYRDEVYNKSPDNVLKGTAELIISKNRCGPCGSVDLYFDPKTCAFRSVERD